MKTRRRLCRERKTLTVERIQHVNRIKGLLFSQGVSDYEPLRRNRRQRLDELKTGDGRPLPPHLKAQISRELDRLELLIEQIKTVETERDALLARDRRNDRATALAPQAMLMQTERDRSGNSPPSSGRRGSTEASPTESRSRPTLAWRQRPGKADPSHREQGVSKAGNPRLRTTMIQLSWLWLRHQPQSALTLWFKERVNRNGGRSRKTTIVALARKLLVALWKYVTAGVVIEGAMMKAG